MAKPRSSSALRDKALGILLNTLVLVSGEALAAVFSVYLRCTPAASALPLTILELMLIRQESYHQHHGHASESAARFLSI